MRPRLALAFLLVIILVLTSCGPGTPTAEEQVTLEYWSMWSEGEAQQQVLATTIAAFEQAHPNIKVNIVWAGRDVLTKLRSAIAGGTTPDLTEHAADELWGALIKGGLVMPLDDALEEQAYGEDVTWSEVFIPGILEPYQYDGKTYFIPYEVITSAFWYDQGWFDNHGITPPETWSELLGICDKLSADGVGFIGGDNDPWYNAYYSYWIAERILGPGGMFRAAGDATGAAWDDPAWLEFGNKTKELSDHGCFVEGYEGNVWPAGQVDWSLGNAGTELCGSWLPNEIRDTALEGFQFRGFPFPEIEGGRGRLTEVESYLIGWVVLNDAPNPQAAIEFMKFAMQEEYQRGIVDVAQNMAARSGLPLPDVIQDMGPMFETSTSFHKPYDGVQAEYGEWWTTILNPLYDELFFGKITPEEFVSEIKAQSIEYWSKPRPTEEPIR